MAEKEKSKKDKKDKAKKPGFFSRIGKWFRDLRSECKKVVWPTRKQVVNNTLVVLGTILLVGVFIWILDFVFNFGVTTFISLVA
ncbi:MAG: preprotein translocase subunit SecE [Butyricicoccaceae bacterium]